MRLIVDIWYFVIWYWYFTNCNTKQKKRNVEKYNRRDSGKEEIRQIFKTTIINLGRDVCGINRQNSKKKNKYLGEKNKDKQCEN